MDFELLHRRRKDRRAAAGRLSGDVRMSLAPWLRGIAAGVALWVGAAAAEPGLPDGFVYLRDVDPSIRQDIRYAGSHNFLGRPADGYGAAECVLTDAAAQAIRRVQAGLGLRGHALIVWDCYRPARAVADFVRWMGDPDSRMKGEFYPRTSKTQLVALGYIAARSGHSSGSTVDLGLIPLGRASEPARWTGRGPLKPCTAPKGERFDDGAVDLGTGFDCFDELAHFGSLAVAPTAKANRALLRETMVAAGFAPYDREWWHFRLVDEPFPDRVFDFSIPPRRSAR
jgi:D-alanyl-D-alanine dipeptidase